MDAPPATIGHTSVSVRSRRGANRSGDRRVTTVLPASATAARLAREVAREVVAGPEDPRVALVVTELVTNAVRHADATPELTLRSWDGTVRIEVFDSGPGQPVLGSPEATATSGRGLTLVDAVADAWGVERAALGKVVWAELELGQGSAGDESAG
ncbi:MAG TPA: ATP-binding protein [Acidimicrobiales bacterium]|nr:ATP-binding protein [Acidimicrobiales bacterium]